MAKDSRLSSAARASARSSVCHRCGSRMTPSCRPARSRIARSCSPPRSPGIRQGRYHPLLERQCRCLRSRLCGVQRPQRRRARAGRRASEQACCLCERWPSSMFELAAEVIHVADPQASTMLAIEALSRTMRDWAVGVRRAIEDVNPIIGTILPAGRSVSRQS